MSLENINTPAPGLKLGSSLGCREPLPVHCRGKAASVRADEIGDGLSFPAQGLLDSRSAESELHPVGDLRVTRAQGDWVSGPHQGGESCLATQGDAVSSGSKQNSGKEIMRMLTLLNSASSQWCAQPCSKRSSMAQDSKWVSVTHS